MTTCMALHFWKRARRVPPYLHFGARLLVTRISQLISIILGVFNLLPIFPLDGHRVIPAFLTDQAAHSYMQFQGRYGFLILIVLIALPFLTGGQFGILFEVMSPVINLLSHLFAGNGDVFGFD